MNIHEERRLTCAGLSSVCSEPSFMATVSEQNTMHVNTLYTYHLQCSPERIQGQGDFLQKFDSLADLPRGPQPHSSCLGLVCSD